MRSDTLRTLIDRLVDELGPGTAPATIERVAHAALDVLSTDGTAGTAAPPRSEGERFILTAYGCDTPGVLARITGTLSDARVNVLDVSQKILQGYFTLILIADLGPSAESLTALQKHLTAVADEMNVRINVQHEDLFYAMHRP